MDGGKAASASNARTQIFIFISVDGLFAAIFGPQILRLPRELVQNFSALLCAHSNRLPCARQFELPAFLHVSHSGIVFDVCAWQDGREIFCILPSALSSKNWS